MEHRELWKIVARWSSLFLIFFFIQYLIIDKIVYYHIHGTTENVAIPPADNPQIVPLWLMTDEDLHVVMYPCFFAAHQQQFHDSVLNQAIPSARFTYYRLWLVNFTTTPVAFVDTMHRIRVTCKDGTSFDNTPLSPLLHQMEPAVRKFVQILCQHDMIPPGNMKEYLVAFPLTLSSEKIQTVQILWDRKNHTLTHNLSLRRYLDGYLQRPSPTFWSQVQTTDSR